jgi:phenylacetic acid degradation operon negative regulatory protein
VFAAAAARIFGPAGARVGWRFLLGEEVTPELAARGFAAIAPGVLLGPDDGRPAPGIAFRADWQQDRAGLRALAAGHWRLAERAAALDGFVARFEPLQRALVVAPPEPESALLARLLLVHSWRGLVLDDPRLPAEALPEGWREPEARALFARLYVDLSAGADLHVHRAFTGRDGRFPAETAATRQRLEGLARP